MMPEKEVVLTVAGLRKLEAELDYLKRVKRREIAERIKQAIEYGDISENLSTTTPRTSRRLSKAR